MNSNIGNNFLYVFVVLSPIVASLTSIPVLITYGFQDSIRPVVSFAGVLSVFNLLFVSVLLRIVYQDQHKKEVKNGKRT